MKCTVRTTFAFLISFSVFMMLFTLLQYITYKVVQKAILLLWAAGAAVTCLPFLNFGLFYKNNVGCLRYRDATLPKDIAYAYLFFAFGKSLQSMYLSIFTSINIRKIFLVGFI